MAARDVNIGYPRDESQSVTVNSEVTLKLDQAVSNLDDLIDEQHRTQKALGIILGQELDLGDLED